MTSLLSSVASQFSLPNRRSVRRRPGQMNRCLDCLPHTEELYVGVGGRIGEEIRAEVADQLNERLPSSKEIRYRYSEMKNRGRKESNIVNRITESGSDGLQIEMTPKTSYNYWKRVARSVRDVYIKLL